MEGQKKLAAFLKMVIKILKIFKKSHEILQIPIKLNLKIRNIEENSHKKASAFHTFVLKNAIFLAFSHFIMAHDHRATLKNDFCTI